jgi:hypothetical protein
VVFIFFECGGELRYLKMFECGEFFELKLFCDVEKMCCWRMFWVAMGFILKECDFLFRC